MRQYAYLTQFGHPYFKKAFIVSLILHFVLMLSSIILPMIPMFKGKKGVLRYSATVRVDLVELPREVIRDLDRNIISTQDAIKSLRNRMDSIYRLKSKKKSKTRAAIKRQKKAKAAIARLKNLKTVEKEQRAEKRDVRRQGNIKKEGVVTPTTLGGKELDAYRSLLVERIKLRWALPSYIRRMKNLSGELIIFLDRYGNVIRKKIVSSGNREFDEYMNRSLEEALPFPKIPDELRRDLRYDGLSITFLSGELK